MALGSTQPLTKMSTRKIFGGKWLLPARKAENLTAICEPVVYGKCGSLDVSQPYGPPRPVTGIALPYFSVTCTVLITSRRVWSKIWGEILRIYSQRDFCRTISFAAI
jgi:hypothetical protein